jgi:hypothetical protein
LDDAEYARMLSALAASLSTAPSVLEGTSTRMQVRRCRIATPGSSGSDGADRRQQSGATSCFGPSSGL